MFVSTTRQRYITIPLSIAMQAKQSSFCDNFFLEIKKLDNLAHNSVVFLHSPKTNMHHLCFGILDVFKIVYNLELEVWFRICFILKFQIDQTYVICYY